MGSWSADMFGSDDALDVVGHLGSLIEYDDEVNNKSLYPIPTDPEERKEIKACLKDFEEDILIDKQFKKNWHVVACVYMDVGARIPKWLKKKAIKTFTKELHGIEDDGWRDGGKERIRVLQDSLGLLKNYNNKPVNIEHTGLFEKISVPKLSTIHNLPYTKEEFDQYSIEAIIDTVNMLRDPSIKIAGDARMQFNAFMVHSAFRLVDELTKERVQEAKESNNV